MIRPLAAALALCLATPVLAQSTEEEALAREILNAAQERSFKRNREFCGMIGVDENGQLVFSKPRRGRRDSCKPRDPRDAVELIASYHTHGKFSEYADSEVPSVDDILSDMEEGVDGWISTPGGRLWFVDGQTGIARQICGTGCMITDPDFEPEVFGPVARRYTVETLEARTEAQDED